MAARFVWIQVGEGGDYSRFDGITAAIDWLNTLCVGKCEAWLSRGFITPNYWGRDFITCYWGDEGGKLVSQILHNERGEFQDRLEENYL